MFLLFVFSVWVFCSRRWIHHHPCPFVYDIPAR